MRRSRYSEEQIIGMLRDHDAGGSTKEICRKYGISDATFYKYKAKFGGMRVSDAQRLKTLELENGRLKRFLADAMLDNAALKDIASKTSNARREAPGRAAHDVQASDERASGLHSCRARPVDLRVPEALRKRW